MDRRACRPIRRPQRTRDRIEIRAGRFPGIMEKTMKMILALALLTAPAIVEAAKPKLPIGPMHCTPRGCTETIRPW